MSEFDRSEQTCSVEVSARVETPHVESARKPVKSAPAKSESVSELRHKPVPRKSAQKQSAMKTDRPQPLAIPRKEVARILGLSLSTVDRAIKRKDLKVKKYGTRVLVPVGEVERFASLDRGQ
jgi:excisionase family DNA binding protein